MIGTCPIFHALCDKLASTHALVAACIAASFCGTCEADWPQFLGSERNGSAPDETILTEFENGEPDIVWTREVGNGFAGPAVADGKVYVFHRKGDRALLDALTADKGVPIWSFGYATDYKDDFGFDNGPRAVPSVGGGRVYISGAEGMLHCLNTSDGSLEWAVDLRETVDADKGFFGRAPSPLLVGDTLIVQAGGKGAGLIGIDSATGEQRWTATDHDAGYASPIMAKIDGKNRILAFTRDGFVCLDPADGKVLIEKKHRAAMNASVNAASPIFFEPDSVFLSACYDVGACLWRIDPEKRATETLWAAVDRLDCHYATPVRFGEFLIGFHGRQETGTVLRCIDAATGKVQWSSDRLPAGSVTLAGKTLIVLTDRGELILAEADPKRFEPSARGQILGTGTRAMPAISDGHLYARDKNKLVCVKLLATPPIKD